MNKSLLIGVVLLAVAACNRGDGPSASATVGMQMLTSPAGSGSAGLHLAKTMDGDVVMSWLEPEGTGHALKFSVLAESHWQVPRTVAQGDTWFVNWADFPSVVPISHDLWAAHWLKKQPGGRYAYNVAISLSQDSGRTWSAPVTPHTDGTATEHGFVSLYPVAGGVGTLWLDGRNMIEDQPHSEHSLGDELQGMTLRSATLTADLGLSDEQQVDSLTCDCCQTDVGIGADGAIAIYRNRDAGEIRDIYVSRSVNGKWQEPLRVSNDGWKIAGCPVNGPAIDANGKNVSVAWFTAANDQSAVLIARSENAGISFSDPITIDNEKPLGRVDVVLLSNGDTVVSWLSKSAGNDAKINARLVTPEGKVGSAVIIAETTASRTSGFPQMISVGADLLFAWAEVSDNQSQVVTARIPVENL
ncbi:MAG TPA: exo-alpha-sialidase [Woeseiaceae bacterium]|nr:exo-alpha-sialidase [Woeseiaceae bacterium]